MSRPQYYFNIGTVNISMTVPETKQDSIPKKVSDGFTVTHSCPGDLGLIINVSPVPSSSFGTICAWVTLAGPAPAYGMYAYVYPLTHPNPPNDPTTVPGASQGSQSGNTFSWSQLKNPVYAPAPDGATNYLVFWIQEKASLGYKVLCTIQFTGVSSGGVSCCGSSSTSTSVNVIAKELGNARSLHVRVPNGANAGTHSATTCGHLEWKCTIGGIQYVLISDARSNFQIQGPLGSVSALTVDIHPFSATFPGPIFGAHSDIVVTRA